MRVHARPPSFLRIAFRILAILAITLPLATQPAVLAQEVTPQADCPANARLSGVSDGSPGSYYPFTATLTGASGLLSLAIDWYKDGVLQTSVAEDPSTQEYSWTAGGIKTVSVTARAQIPGTRSSVSAEHRITISPMPVAEVPLASSLRLPRNSRGAARGHTQLGRCLLLRPVGRRSRRGGDSLYRPGITYPAYYEFQVFGPSDPNTLRGFIIVSTGDHDHPITN